MLQVSLARLQQGHRTIAYPASRPPCRTASAVCPSSTRPSAPTAAGPAPRPARPMPSRSDGNELRLDLGRCLFCTDCIEACPEGAIRYTQDYRLATRERERPGPGGPGH